VHDLIAVNAGHVRQPLDVGDRLPFLQLDRCPAEGARELPPHAQARRILVQLRSERPAAELDDVAARLFREQRQRQDEQRQQAKDSHRTTAMVNGLSPACAFHPGNEFA
jgi:hypothetical protein